MNTIGECQGSNISNKMHLKVILGGILATAMATGCSVLPQESFLTVSQGLTLSEEHGGSRECNMPTQISAGYEFRPSGLQLGISHESGIDCHSPNIVNHDSSLEEFTRNKVFIQKTWRGSR